MTPIILEALTAPAAMPPPVAAYRPRIFPENPFVELCVKSIVEDHAFATVGGAAPRPYAIGHLPDEVRRLLSPSSAVGASLADSARRTILGRVSDQIIEDVRDDWALACPLAISAIRLYSNDPARVLVEYAARAAMIGDVMGKEFGRDGATLVYRGAARRLTVDISTEGWMLDGDSLLIPHLLPATLCAAAAGRQLRDIVEHPMLDGIDAVVTGAERTGRATTISYRTQASGLHLLTEIKGESA